MKQEVDDLKTRVNNQVNETHARELYRGMTWVIDGISLNKLTLNKCLPGRSQKKEWYTIVPCEFSFQGSFENIMNFLRTLSSSVYALECVKCYLKVTEDANLQGSVVLNFLVVDDVEEM